MTRRGFRGTPLTFTRGPTSRELLQIDWDYPVFDPDGDGAGQGTRAVTALPAERAFEIVAKADRRPLLVVRECTSCQGTDVALLSTRHDNDRTLLLTRWFHCVKLPPHVLHPDHPFHKLFGDGEAPHLFLSSHDGSGRIGLDGAQSQSKLWKAMTRVLRREYEGNAGRAVKEMLKLLDQFDRVDALQADLMADLDRELERRGHASPKIRKLQDKLQALGREHEELMARARELQDLGLRAPAPGPGK